MAIDPTKPPEQPTEYGWDIEGNAVIGKLVTITRKDLQKAIDAVCADIIRYGRYFVTFPDLTRDIIATLEKKMNIPPAARLQLEKEFEDWYKTQKPLFAMNLPVKQRTEFGLKSLGFGVKDQKSIEYASSMNDFYFGKFFSHDPAVRKDTLNWMNKYYLMQGNPIGKGTEGIKTFSRQLGDYVSVKTDQKARQIIDTSVNYIRNSSRIHGLNDAGFTEYQIFSRETGWYARSVNLRMAGYSG